MTRPNIVIIQTDQQSLWTLSCYGGGEIQTPNIDSLAETGAQFNHFYTVSAVCTPSRGSFVSGQYPHTNGAFRNDAPIRQEVATFPKILRKEGYHTAFIGKWHLDGGDSPGWMIPERAMGFVDCRYMFNSGHFKAIIEGSEDRPEVVTQIPGDQKTYTTDFLTDKTIETIQGLKDHPFLVMLSLPDPHQPYNVRAPYDTMYKPEDMTIPTSFYQAELPDWAEEDTWGRQRYFPIDLVNREEKLRRIKAQYCGEVKCIDDNVGKLLNFLKEEDLDNNTIIVFTTDHGEYMGEHGLLEKNNLYDSVYHIPLLMSWPEKIKPGSRVDQYVSVVDFQQTLLGLLGIDCSGDEEGFDASPLLKGETIPWDDVIFIHPSDVPRAGIITPEYELAYVGRGWKREKNHEFRDHILFDRIMDPEMMYNLFKKKELVNTVDELKEKMMRHFGALRLDEKVLPPELFR